MKLIYLFVFVYLKSGYTRKNYSIVSSHSIKIDYENPK